MEIALLILCVLLIGEGWLLFEMLKQQGRLLLRIEAAEARLTEADVETRTMPAGGSVTGLAVGTPAPSGGYPLNTLPTAAQSNGNGSRPARPVALKIGDVAPAFSLPDLAGQLVHLSDFRGSSTLLLFWRPGCGFCQRMLADLKIWEAECEEEAPGLLVVSSESVAHNQAMGLRSPIILDQATIRVGSLFGVTGTPMAVLVDAEGRIASELAAGAPAVLALANHKQEKTTTA